MAQNGSENGHKIAKNSPNELEFGPNMYFYEFYQIPEDVCDIFKISRFLAKKRSFTISNLFFTEIVSRPSKMIRFG